MEDTNEKWKDSGRPLISDYLSIKRFIVSEDKITIPLRNVVPLKSKLK